MPDLTSPMQATDAPPHITAWRAKLAALRAEGLTVAEAHERAHREAPRAAVRCTLEAAGNDGAREHEARLVAMVQSALAAPEGVEPVGSGRSRPALPEWRALVRAKREAGMSRADAEAAVDKERPGLRGRAIKEANK